MMWRARNFQKKMHNGLEEENLTDDGERRKLKFKREKHHPFVYNVHHIMESRSF